MHRDVTDPDLPLLWYLRDLLQFNGHQVWLRNGTVRRVHGSRERRGHSQLPYAFEDCRRENRCHH